MAGNARLFDGTMICGVLVVLLLQTCFPLSPINNNNTNTDLSASCKVGFDCCEFCSTSDDCIYWLNCCDRDKNKNAKRLLNIDCVSIVDSEDFDLDTDDIATVVKCPNGTLCDRGTFVAGKNFVYISEACAACNQEDDYMRINISLYGTRNNPRTVAQDIFSINDGSTVFVDMKLNKDVPIRHCNKDLENQYESLGTMCKKFRNNAWACNSFTNELFCCSAKFIFCHTCDGYAAFNCQFGGQRRSLSGGSITFGYVLNSFDFAELIGKRIVYDGQARIGDVCPKGHVLSLSKVDCLPVSCPYQMVMTERGCVESDADIKLTHFAVHVGLSPTSKTVPNFNEMTHLQKQQPFTWMKTPCSKIGWTDVGMYSTNKTDVHYARFKDYLLVRLEYFNSRALSLKNIRRVIDLCLKETWTLHIGEHVHIYDAEIFPYIRIDKFRPLRYIGIYGYYRIQLDTIFFMMKGHVMSAHIGRGPFELSKLYFCYMIRVKEADVKWSLEPNLTLLETNRTVRSSSFEYVECKTCPGGSVFLICLDEYAPVVLNKSSLDDVPWAMIILFLMTLALLSNRH